MDQKKKGKRSKRGNKTAPVTQNTARNVMVPTVPTGPFPFQAVRDKDDLAARVLKVVISEGQSNGLNISTLDHKITALLNVKFEDRTELRTFLNRFEDVFIITPTDNPNAKRMKEKVFGSTGITLCEEHSHHAGRCPGDCNGLHICKFYVLSKCLLPENGHGKCLFGHKMGIKHNKKVLRSHLLHRLEGPELVFLLRRAENRNRTTMPTICTHYNIGKGCKYKENVRDIRKMCKYLHLCKHFVDNKCKFGPRCNRSHDIYQIQPANLLQMYGFDVQDTDREEIEFLLNKFSLTSMRTHTESQSTYDSDDFETVVDDEDDDDDDDDDDSEDDDESDWVTEGSGEEVVAAPCELIYKREESGLSIPIGTSVPKTAPRSNTQKDFTQPVVKEDYNKKDAPMDIPKSVAQNNVAEEDASQDDPEPSGSSSEEEVDNEDEEVYQWQISNCQDKTWTLDPAACAAIEGKYQEFLKASKCRVKDGEDIIELDFSRMTGQTLSAQDTRRWTIRRHLAKDVGDH